VQAGAFPRSAQKGTGFSLEVRCREFAIETERLPGFRRLNHRAPWCEIFCFSEGAFGKRRERRAGWQYDCPIAMDPLDPELLSCLDGLEWSTSGAPEGLMSGGAARARQLPRKPSSRHLPPRTALRGPPASRHALTFHVCPQPALWMSLTARGAFAGPRRLCRQELFLLRMRGLEDRSSRSERLAALPCRTALCTCRRRLSVPHRG
jgi:hypothetical protein